MLKRLAGCVRQYKGASLLSPLFVVLEVIMEVIIPLLMAKLIDDGIDGANQAAILKTGGILAVCCILSLLFGILAGHFAAKASAGFAKNIRHDLFHVVQGFSFFNIDRFSASSLVTRLTTDVTNLQNAYQMIVRVALRSPAMLIFSLAMAIRISPKLSIIFLIAIPILGAFVFFLMSSVHPIFERVFRTYDKLNNVVQENVHGVRVVKAFVREDHEISKFAKISQKIYADFCKAEGRLSFSMPGMQVAVYSCMLLLSWFGARIIVGSGGSDLTTGELMSLMTYALQILGALMMLFQFLFLRELFFLHKFFLRSSMHEKMNPSIAVRELPAGEAAPASLIPLIIFIILCFWCICNCCFRQTFPTGRAENTAGIKENG